MAAATVYRLSMIGLIASLKQIQAVELTTTLNLANTIDQSITITIDLLIDCCSWLQKCIICLLVLDILIFVSNSKILIKKEI